MRRFHRPHAPAEPLEERQIVRESAKERLTEVDVRLNQSRQHIPAAGVDDPIVTSAGIDTTDRFNPTIPDRHVARHDVQAIVHGEDGAGADAAENLTFKISDLRFKIGDS